MSSAISCSPTAIETALPDLERNRHRVVSILLTRRERYGITLLMNNAIATAATTVHPFEARGLGQAPFRFVGMGQQDRCYGEVILNRAEYERTGISLTTKPGGTCAYCGQGITNLYNIRSADGKTFHVGCDCVALTGDAKLMTVVKKAALKLAREQRQARAATKAEQLAAILADDA